MLFQQPINRHQHLISQPCIDWMRLRIGTLRQRWAETWNKPYGTLYKNWLMVRFIKQAAVGLELGSVDGPFNAKEIEGGHRLKIEDISHWMGVSYNTYKQWKTRVKQMAKFIVQTDYLEQLLLPGSIDAVEAAHIRATYEGQLRARSIIQTIESHNENNLLFVPAQCRSRSEKIAASTKWEDMNRLMKSPDKKLV
jgi:hypothetical protein